MRQTAPNTGSVGDVALPKNTDFKGRANSLSAPLSRNGGSAGGVAPPNDTVKIGRASLSERAALQDHGSAGGVAPPKNDAPTGGASSPNEPLPKRKKLPHEIPSWVQQGERHFITINCRHRGSDPLLKHAQKLIESAHYYEEIGRWHLWLMLIMPDHIHFIATFDLSKGLKTTISAWKRYQKKTVDIDWQSGFFEHRLRNQSEFDEKAHYIRMNPVRKGLVERPEDWPHVLDRISIDDGSVGDVALPKNNDPTGRASSRNEPQSRRSGSAGGVALPKNDDPTGRASSPNEPRI